jgi:hypothetical protein
MGRCQIREEPPDTLVEDGPVVAARPLAEDTSKPRFADASQAREILPKNSRSKFSFTTPTTRARVNASA